MLLCVVEREYEFKNPNRYRCTVTNIRRMTALYTEKDDRDAFAGISL